MARNLTRQVIFKRVIDALKQHPYGLSSTDLSRIVKINRMTLVKYLTLMQAKGLVEFKNIGMAKVWHTSTKYDMISTLTKDEAGSIQAIVAGRNIKIRERLPDFISLSFFRAVKAAMALSTNSDKALYEAGQLIAKNCLVNFELKDPNLIVEQISRTYLNLGLGIIKPIQISPSLWVFKLDESATAYGTMVRGSTLCHFEAGMLSGILSSILRKRALVQETKCVGTNYTYCEFVVRFSN